MIGIFVLFAAHLLLFLLYADALVYIGDPAWLEGWTALFGPSWIGPRFVSALCALTAVLLMARLTARWSRDDIAGAALPLGYLLFPPAAFVFTQPLPHALVALLTLIGLDLVASSKGRSRSRVLILLGLISVVLTALDATGAAIAVGLLVIFALRQGTNTSDRTGTIFFALIIAGLGWSLPYLSLPLTSGVGDAGPPSTSIFATFILPYSMLWVGLGFAVLALSLSEDLRGLMTKEDIRRSLQIMAAFVFAVFWILFHPRLSDDGLTIAMNGILTLGLMATLPLVIWIRRVMPQLRSLVVWILLPVIMYSCFWVILGPIDLDGFPYDRLRDPVRLGLAQTPG